MRGILAFSCVGAPRISATEFTRRPPTGERLPENVSEIGGLVVDLVGKNGRHVTSQLAASSLFAGFFDTGNPKEYRGNPGTIGIQNGFSREILRSLGGGIRQLSIRLTLFDGDSGPGDFDENQNILRLNGARAGNFSKVVTQETTSDGETALSMNSAGGFRNDKLDTGFFNITDPAALAAVFRKLQLRHRLVFKLQDTRDPYDNFFDFTQGVDAELINIGVPPGVLDPGMSTALPVALSQRDILLSMNKTAVRDVNARLFRLRASTGANEVVAAIAQELATSSSGKEVMRHDASGKTVMGGANETTSEGIGRWKLFAAGDLGSAESDDRGGAVGFDSDTHAATVGAELPITKHLTVGLAGSYVQNDTDFGLGNGGAEIEGYALSGYVSGTWGGFYADALYSFGSYEDRIRRQTPLGGIAKAEPESRNHTVELNTGYNFHVARLLTGPTAALEYVNGSLEGYRESGGELGNVRMDEQDYDSLVSRLGWQASVRVPTRVGTITPQIRASWDHEYKKDTDTVTATLLNAPAISATGRSQEPERNYLNIGGGILAELSDRWTVVVDYEAHIARDNLSEHFASVKLGVTF